MKPLAALYALILAGCTSGGQLSVPGDDARVAPDVRAIIMANKGRLWKDPDSIKSAQIGTAPARHMGSMWHVCVKLNAKNALGGYTGEKYSLIGIYDDPNKQPEVLIENADINCRAQQHVPFAELNGDYKPAQAKR